MIQGLADFLTYRNLIMHPSQVLLSAALACSVCCVSVPTNGSALPIVDLGYELHQATFNASGQYYNFSNVRYAAPPVGDLRFAKPTSPTGFRVFNNGSKAVTCNQVIPSWGNTTAAWEANGTAAFNISAGYHPPNITTLPANSDVQPGATEDCLFLDLMVPKAIFDSAGNDSGAPV